MSNINILFVRVEKDMRKLCVHEPCQQFVRKFIILSASGKYEVANANNYVDGNVVNLIVTPSGKSYNNT